MNRLVLVSNRVALPTDSQPRSGGLAVVLNSSLKRETLWLGWSGEVSNQPRIQRHARKSKAFVVSDVTEAEYEDYYRGYSNSCVYPLLLYRPDLVRFDVAQYQGYLRVCERFADILSAELRPDDSVWVHDNQLMSVVRFLRTTGARQRCGFFLHLPFPPPDIFETLPVAEEMLTDLLQFDLIGFQSELDRQNFTGACRRILGVGMNSTDEISWETRTSKVIVNPVGIKPESFAAMARREGKSPTAAMLNRSLGGKQLIIGAERLDYSKGLPERFEAYGTFLRDHPELRRKVSYLQIAAESRQDVQQYRDLKALLDRSVGNLNGAFAEPGWVPLQYVTRSIPRRKLAAYLAAAGVGLVTPLRDGFNLVAEEYIAAQDPSDPGVLILSKFAGAAELLNAAVIVNPMDTQALANAIYQALTMPQAERKERWKELNEVVQKHTADKWLRDFVTNLNNKDRTAEMAEAMKALDGRRSLKRLQGRRHAEKASSFLV